MIEKMYNERDDELGAVKDKINEIIEVLNTHRHSYNDRLLMASKPTSPPLEDE
jgi:hypothetical protein